MAVGKFIFSEKLRLPITTTAASFHERKSHRGFQARTFFTMFSQSRFFRGGDRGEGRRAWLDRFGSQHFGAKCRGFVSHKAGGNDRHEQPSLDAKAKSEAVFLTAADSPADEPAPESGEGQWKVKLAPLSGRVLAVKR